MKLADRVALITGGGGAMGSAQARLFAAEGAAVCVADLFLDKAQAVADAIGQRAVAVELDVVQEDKNVCFLDLVKIAAPGNVRRLQNDAVHHAIVA